MDAPSHEVFEYSPAFRDVVAKYEAAQPAFVAQNEQLISELTPITFLLAIASLESHNI